MSKTHVVKQGDTMARIARQHKFGSAAALYEHADNTDFRTLRNDPNLIFPGDEITIPDIEQKVMSVSPAKKHTFRLKRDKEVFKIKIQDGLGTAWQGKRIVLNIGGQEIDAMIGTDGIVEVDLPNGDEGVGALDVYMDPSKDEPTHSFEVTLGGLDPVETLSGVQARCNALGHECGVADGVMGGNTKKGVKAFQASNGLDVDGVPGPMTKTKLKEVYGC